MFAIWWRSKQVQPLIDYFAASYRTAKPIELAGFDSQLTGEMSGQYLLDNLTHLASTVALPAEEWKGKRRHQTAHLNVQQTIARGESGTYINAIPISAIDHIEVLRDGAAATVWIGRNRWSDQHHIERRLRWRN